MTTSARPTAVIRPSTVGPVLSTAAALVAAAVMFGLGMFVGRLAAHIAGVTGGVSTGLMYGAAALFAGFSAVSSARRVWRACRRRTAA